MSASFFWDTSGFFALLSTDDGAHSECVKLVEGLRDGRALSVTSDWIVAETCTLLTVLKQKQLAIRFLEMLSASKAIEVVHVNEDLFDEAKKLFIKRKDKSYSFTDCSSFVLMRARKLQKAVTIDKHFAAEGFVSLLSGRD